MPYITDAMKEYKKTYIVKTRDADEDGSDLELDPGDDEEIQADLDVLNKQLDSLYTLAKRCADDRLEIGNRHGLTNENELHRALNSKAQGVAAQVDKYLELAELCSNIINFYEDGDNVTRHTSTRR